MMIPEHDTDASIEPAFLRQLTDDQKSRLTEQLDQYLRALETGTPISGEELARQNLDLREVFAVYLRKLDALYGVAVGFQNTAGAGLADLSEISGSSLTLGDFTIIREIGRGGMGVVYEAHQHSLNRQVALKLLPMASLLDSRQIARFRNEAHAAGLLRAITLDDPPRLGNFLPAAPADLGVVLQKAMAKRKDDRYESAGQFADDLRAVFEGRPTLAKPPSFATLIGRWTLRHHTAVTVGGSVLALALVWLMISSVIIRQKVQDAQFSEIRADRYVRQGHSIVEHLGSRVAEQLASVPGAEHVRQSLLRETQELAESQSIDAEGPRPGSSWHPRRTADDPEPPSSVWLNETSGLSLSPTTHAPIVTVGQADVQAKLAATTSAGWTVGIGLFEAFETTEQDSKIGLLLPPTFAAADASCLNVHSSNSLHESESGDDESASPSIAPATLVAGITVAIFGVHQFEQRSRNRHPSTIRLIKRKMNSEDPS